MIVIWSIIGSMYLITGITAFTTYMLCSPVENNENENKKIYKKNGYLEYVSPSEACTISPLYYYTFDEEEF